MSINIWKPINLWETYSLISSAYSIDSQDWEEVATGDNIIYNRSSVYIRVHYGNTTPLLSTKNYLVIPPNQSTVKRGGIPSGNTYVRTDKEDGDTSPYKITVVKSSA